ncbi:MAG: hypothetical protein B7Y99_00260 [Caulobacterales bacterium 32-69-10]|nr:MAG: hypothetical protein B7Y99_00260 [Caulobacterales bacterium 32-69-10]
MFRDNPELLRFVEWIQASSTSMALVEVTADQPLSLLFIQTLHILGVSVIIGAGWLSGVWLLGVVPLRNALGASPRRLVMACYPALCVLALTGLVLIIRRPDRILLSTSFPIKLVLIAVGLSLMIALDRSLRGDEEYWGRTDARRIQARILGLAIIVIWSATVFAARWIPFA